MSTALLAQAPAPAPASAPAAAASSSNATLHQLTVVPDGWQVPVAPQHSLLQAARAAGLSLPSACRNGTCRACLCRLVSGSIHYQIDQEPVGLGASQARSGPSQDSFCRICRPIVQLWDKKRVFSESGEAKNGPLRPFCSRRSPSPTGSWPGLLAEEKADGRILPCVASAASHVVIEAPRAIRLLGD